MGTFAIKNITTSIPFLKQNGSDFKPTAHEGFVVSSMVQESIKEKENQYQHIKKLIIEEKNERVFNFYSKYIELTSPQTLIISTTTRFNILYQQKNYNSIINLKRINDIRYINKFFESINSKIEKNGLFIGCVDTKNLRKKRILKKYPIGINILLYMIDFVFKRVLPKFNLTKHIYFYFTRGKNRVLTRAETLGRLYSCGFEVVEEKKISNILYFIVKKIKDPAYDTNPTYGPIVKLKRIGKDGKLFTVYKMRTMHPYSEYLQDYIYKKFDLKQGGKFKNDFRITTLGRIMRKFWIDELPMIWNMLKGDMKLVGVRPLSRHYFSLYSKEVQEARIKTKPGLIPPFYADMPETLEEIQKSEMNYLRAYSKHPFKTDVHYMFKALSNILIKRKRSA